MLAVQIGGFARPLERNAPAFTLLVLATPYVFVDNVLASLGLVSLLGMLGQDTSNGRDAAQCCHSSNVFCLAEDREYLSDVALGSGAR
jgi:hypothetical protein